MSMTTNTERAGGASLLSRLPNVSILGPIVALLVAITFFSTQHENFFTLGNFTLILQQVSFVAVLSIGQTLIILTAGIDLSNGVIMALGNIVMTKIAVENGVNPVLAILIGLAVTTALGWANGMLITRLDLPPFIVTLGMYGIVFGTTQLYSRATTISGLPPIMTFLGEKIGESTFTYGTVLMVVLFLVAAFLLSNSAPGRHVYAVGNNPEATRLMGIPTKRVLLGVYTLAGFIYGIAALLLVARTGAGDPNAGQTENLESVTAVVLGGTSLFGGRGMVLGTLLGAIITGVFRNGLTLMGVPSVVQFIITGLLVILAVTTDQLSKRRR